IASEDSKIAAKIKKGDCGLSELIHRDSSSFHIIYYFGLKVIPIRSIANYSLNCIFVNLSFFCCRHIQLKPQHFSSKTLSPKRISPSLPVNHILEEDYGTWT